MRTLALLFLSLAAAAQSEPPPALSGQVINALTSAPLGKARLLLVPAQSPNDWNHSYAATSAPDGKFTIPSIEPGRYLLRISRNGFVATEYPLPLDLPATPPKSLTLRLTPFSVIAGRVLDSDGDPLDQAQVQILRTRYVNGRKTLATLRSASTNDLGEFRVANLKPGIYYLYATSLAGAPPKSHQAERLVPVYYPDAPDSSTAAPITLEPGAEVRTGDIRLPSARTATIRGKVVVEIPNASHPNVRLFLRNSHDASAAGIYSFHSAELSTSGEFVITSVEPGEYLAQAEVGQNGIARAGITPVSVRGNDIEGVTIVINNPSTLSGRLRVDGDAGLDLSKARVELLKGGPAVDASRTVDSGRVQPDRSFRINGVQTDTYALVATQLPQGYYMSRVTVGGADVTYTGFELSSAVASPIEILISRKAGSVSGTVDPPQGRPAAPQLTVALVPKDPVLRKFAFRFADTPAPGGRFSITNVPPGDYLAFAWEDVEPGAWMDPDFLKPWEEHGLAVTVPEAGQASLRLPALAPSTQPH
ncbi:MAG: carboxypeptidase regulatory-like domain-containing protein [Acidobacteria bacterium]|nr:carboxypeptidase regulatory-like domain-containing protein [Acidobacteriota bacterium]